jgi:hypothetical protein
MTRTCREPAHAGPDRTPATPTVRTPGASVADTADLPHARAYGGPPVPGRRLWAVTVLACPVCRGMHQHRAGEAARLLSGRLRRRRPTTGQQYVLAPVARRREAMRHG